MVKELTYTFGRVHRDIGHRTSDIGKADPLIEWCVLPESLPGRPRNSRSDVLDFSVIPHPIFLNLSTSFFDGRTKPPALIMRSNLSLALYVVCINQHTLGRPGLVLIHEKGASYSATHRDAHTGRRHRHPEEPRIQCQYTREAI